ncbi:MAG: D-cysteine desulfhydrase family protein [Fimbriimonas sp.]|nr:D-cysteine desulfhydrase family protein [Fimbriimonas sp.]
MKPPRIDLIRRPTPLHRLNRLSGELNVDLWIKRDDLTGFAMGGNKGRKLEFLMADIVAGNVDVVVTCGAAQSNFVRQLGAACAVLGVRCAAAIMAMPFDVENPCVVRTLGMKGNLVLDKILGIDLRTFPDGTWDQLYDHAEKLAMEFADQGLNVYRVPVGGSSPLGAYGFYEAAKEIDQAFDCIVFASSSGSTHVGLAYGFAGTSTRILGIACDPEPEIANDFAALAQSVRVYIPDGPDLKAADFDLDFGYVGPGYGIASEAGDAAIERLARSEGIFLDPIYTGKAFAGLLDLVQSGRLGGRILFWHTGGTPALFV